MDNTQSGLPLKTALDGCKVILVAQHIGLNAGGEAIKSYQYAQFLKDIGADLTVLAHERSLTEMGADPEEHDYRLVTDSPLQRLFWRIAPLRVLLPIDFHLRARRIIRQIAEPSQSVIVHYVAPISPVVPRFPPKGYRIVMGPLSGGIYYPSAFWDRMTLSDRMRARLHRISQRLLGLFVGDKKVANTVLVSGYERTRASLRLAKCRDEQMVDVVDSGIHPAICDRDRIQHAHRKANFMCSGRLVPVKALDLAIRAVERADDDVRLSIYGDGSERAGLEALSKKLGLQDRITFHGWTDHDKLIEAYADYRGYIFPSLADSNGIVMQEAMMAGVPVVALRWGGPVGLANDDSAIFVNPISEDQVINELSNAMNLLAGDPEKAEAISIQARARAEAHFPWPAVAGSWIRAY